MLIYYHFKCSKEDACKVITAFETAQIYCRNNMVIGNTLSYEYKEDILVISVYVDENDLIKSDEE